MENSQKKICRTCGTVKSFDEFYKQERKNSRINITSQCKECINKKKKEYAKNNQLKRKNVMLKYFHGITIDDYNEMFKNQFGLCAICGTHQKDLNMPLHVDHNHTTGAIRGLLCGSCNLALGAFNDDYEILEKVIDYLDD